MPPVTRVQDQNVLVETASFPYAKWKFSHFNPIQSRTTEFYDKENNGVIAASTSSGKTVVAEQFLSHEIRKRGGKGLFLAPLRALAREKVNEWMDKNNHFGDLKISICTGDYRLTNERVKELAAADLIIMTSEMLSSRCRNWKSEKSDFLMDIGTLIVDESHMLAVPGRGDHLEVGLMKFTEMNPNARIILLSATMPNVEQIADWVSYSLTGKQTFVLRSNYRPVPLTIHYEPYEDSDRRYDSQENAKVAKAMEILEYYPDDKFLVFAHTKKTGELMRQALAKKGVETFFHSSDLDNAARANVEGRFRNDPKLKVIVATSTLAAGLNLPARRVIILGLTRGLSDVDSHEITQMCGRSGRLGIDPMGDAYILLPASRVGICKNRLTTVNEIHSQLLERSGEHHKTLAFHLISEIHHGSVETTGDIHAWYKRSLAYFQNKTLEESVVDSTLSLLERYGAAYTENGKWYARPIGKVASMFYFSPFDASGLYFNFRELFAQGKEGDDHMVSIALANIDGQWSNIVSKAERDEMAVYAAKVRELSPGKNINESCMKAGFCYFNLLNGVQPYACATTQRGLQFDYNRLSQVLQSLDTMTGQWGMEGFFKNLEGRMVSGLPSHLVSLCRLPNIGRVRATRLYEAGIKTVEAFADADPDRLRNLLNMKPEAVRELIDKAEICVMAG